MRGIYGNDQDKLGGHWPIQRFSFRKDHAQTRSLQADAGDHTGIEN